MQDQPSGGESAREWLLRTGWLPQAGGGGVTTTSDESEAGRLLPQGHAYRVAMTVDSGTEAASRVIIYAISTSQGFAVVQILGDPEPFWRAPQTWTSSRCRPPSTIDRGGRVSGSSLTLTQPAPEDRSGGSSLEMLSGRSKKEYAKAVVTM